MSDPSLADRPETYVDDRIETLRDQLYGEEVMVDTAVVDDVLVGISTHRVLMLAPDDAMGPVFQSVALPNVTGFVTGAGGKQAFGTRAIRTGIYSAVLLGAGNFVDLDGLIDPISPPSGAGIGGVLSLVDLLIQAIGLVDDGLVVLGLLALIASLYFVGRYLGSRDRYFEVTVAGGDHLRIPVGKGADPPIDRLEAAVEKASNASVS